MTPQPPPNPASEVYNQVWDWSNRIAALASEVVDAQQRLTELPTTDAGLYVDEFVEDSNPDRELGYVLAAIAELREGLAATGGPLDDLANHVGHLGVRWDGR